MDFGDISAFTHHHSSNSPFAGIYMKNMRVRWMRDKKFENKIHLFGSNLKTTSFEWVNEKLVEKGFLNILDKYVEYEMEPKSEKMPEFDIKIPVYKRYLSTIPSYNNFKIFELKNFDEENIDLSLTVSFNSKIGDKNVHIFLSSVKIMLRTSIYMQLFHFTEIDESVYPPKNESKIIKEKIFKLYKKSLK